MISVIIPAYNEEKRISRCLESVFSQDYSFKYEVLVVDNNSSDRTAEIVKDNFPKARIIFEEKKRVVVARNRGSKEAKGNILIFLDADVIIPEDHIRKILKKLKRDKNVILVSGSYFYYDGSFYVKFLTIFFFCLGFLGEYLFNRFLNLASSINAGNFAVYKDCFEKVGGFNENIDFYGDEAYITSRLRKIGKVRFCRNLSIKSSARRFEKGGALKTCLKYAVNNVWQILFRKPFSKSHIDIR
ncbi:MAG: glycosyltransferase [Candidatus Nealsonbacteria bacterium]